MLKKLSRFNITEANNALNHTNILVKGLILIQGVMKVFLYNTPV